MKNIIYFAMMTMAVMITACSNDDTIEDIQTVPSNSKEESKSVALTTKTVLVYMAGRNTLTTAVDQDLDEIKEGSKRLGSGDNMLVFIRRFNEKTPWLARIKNGEVTDSVSVSDMGITSSDGLMRASDPVVMEGVMKYAFNRYPASTGHYGLVLWGHGTGWLMKEEVSRTSTRAYGVDYGRQMSDQDGRWINIPTMAEVLRGMPHLKYIMADCCNFMCLEILYELRNVCDYIIGSPAEIPGEGAPYDEIMSDLFADGTFYTNIVDKYYKSISGFLPLTAVKTAEMENMAQATRQAMQAINTTIGDNYADMTGIIHYYHTNNDSIFHPEHNIFYDAGNYIIAHAPQEVYQQWRQALDRLVLDTRMATRWTTDKIWWQKYSDFTVTTEKYHGVSMFVPQNPSAGHYKKYNEDIKQMSWYKTVF